MSSYGITRPQWVNGFVVGTIMLLQWLAGLRSNSSITKDTPCRYTHHRRASRVSVVNNLEKKTHIIPGGPFKNTYELLNLRALKLSKLYKKMHVSMYGYKILCGISKVPFEIPHKISYPYTEKCAVENLRALRFKSSYAFLKPPRIQNSLLKPLNLHSPQRIGSKVHSDPGTFLRHLPYLLWPGR